MKLSTILILSFIALSACDFNYPYTLADLPYAYDALEPNIDKLTMTIHHDKHHLAYINNLNAAVKDNDWKKLSLESIFRICSQAPVAIRNNGGGHWNHDFFWKTMKANGGGDPTGPLADAIKKTFGTFDAMRTAVNSAGTSRFGSGWTWLISNNGRLSACSTAN